MAGTMFSVLQSEKGVNEFEICHKKFKVYVLQTKPIVETIQELIDELECEFNLYVTLQVTSSAFIVGEAHLDPTGSTPWLREAK